MIKFLGKSSQVAVFVIIALVIIVGIVGYVLIKNNVFNPIPSSISPVYDYYISCLDQSTKQGASIMASRGGYLYSPEFSAGSEYAPFSSQLAFMGSGIPYWYYISGNGLKKEQIPTLANMQKELAKYVQEESVVKCDFSNFVAQGYTISFENSSSAKIQISDNKIKLNFNKKLTITKNQDSYTISNYNLETNSNLGSYYNLAKKVYDYEQNTLFLENYSQDVLYNYAPVDGVVLNCSPTIWNPYEIVNTLKNALVANIGAIKVNGDYYSLKKTSDKYFVVGEEAGFNLKNEKVNFIYSSSWTSRFEVWPTKSNLMIANPVGTQQGLSAFGFCYAPYKFVYDMYFPVLIQISNGDAGEIFQFPMAVVINKNQPREAIVSDYINDTQNLCDNANSPLSIQTYNNNLEPVEANIRFKCLNTVCDLGKTVMDNSTNRASLNVNVPQCYNGFLISDAKGYGETRAVISTNEETNAEIILQKEYTLPLEVYVDGAITNENAVLMMYSVDGNQTSFVDSVSYPAMKEVKLKQGAYSFELKVYKNGNVVIPATSTRQCLNQPQEGLLGILGMEEEKCYDLTVPGQTLTNVLYAGGSSNSFYTDDVLGSASAFRVSASSVKLPSTLEEVQISSDAVENKKIEVSLI